MEITNEVSDSFKSIFDVSDFQNGIYCSGSVKKTYLVGEGNPPVEHKQEE